VLSRPATLMLGTWFRLVSQSSRSDRVPATVVSRLASRVPVSSARRTVLVHALIAVGVNAVGKREILGLDVTSSEDGAGWLASFRGLSGVLLVTSDAHAGMVAAIAAALPGASWQRCRFHYAEHSHPDQRCPRQEPE
jgi:putative transposase